MVIIFSGSCLAGKEINQSLPVESTGKVLVEIPRGLVNIHGWDKQEILVQGIIDDTIKQLIFKTKKGKTTIKVDTDGQKHWGDASELTIFMPQQLKLRFQGIDTSFNVTKIKSHIEGKSINGSLTAKDIHGKIKLSVVSGDVKLIDSSGLTKIESVSGMINFSGDFKKASLNSVSGDISAEITGTKELTIKNISGDTVIKGQVKSKAKLKLTSVSGDIWFKGTEVLNAECEIVSQFGGDINNQLTDDLPTKGNLNKKSLSFTSGDGSAKLQVNTVNGSVTIEKL